MRNGQLLAPTPANIGAPRAGCRNGAKRSASSGPEPTGATRRGIGGINIRGGPSASPANNTATSAAVKAPYVSRTSCGHEHINSNGATHYSVSGATQHPIRHLLAADPHLGHDAAPSPPVTLSSPRRRQPLPTHAHSRALHTHKFTSSTTPLQLDLLSLAIVVTLQGRMKKLSLRRLSIDCVARRPSPPLQVGR